MQNTIKPFNQKMFTMGIGGVITGLLVGLVGLATMSLRVKLAVVFLGARALFDTPFAQVDAIKVGMVMLVAIGIFLSGLGLFAGGTIVSLVEFSRKKQ